MTDTPAPEAVEGSIVEYCAAAPSQPEETCPLINGLYNEIRSIAEDVVTEPDWARSRLEDLAPKTGSWTIRSGTALEKIRVANAELRAFGNYWENAADKLADRLDAAEARALPAPRRYTGGPLEDGLYLWRFERWDAGRWESEFIKGGRIQPWWARGRTPEEPLFLIGPISIPPIPESEEQSNGHVR